MTTPPEYQQKKDRSKVSVFLDDQLYDLTDIPEILVSPKKLRVSKKSYKRTSVIKRASPFLITAICLPFLFTYLFMKDENNKSLLLFLLVFTEVNILFIDFALWNYYEGRKKLEIWLIELFIVISAFYCFHKVSIFNITINRD